MSDAVPRLTSVQLLRVELHRARVQIAELKFAVADKEAAIASLLLTNERDALAQEFDTPEWRYDWTQFAFVKRGASDDHAA